MLMRGEGMDERTTTTTSTVQVAVGKLDGVGHDTTNLLCLSSMNGVHRFWARGPAPHPSVCFTPVFRTKRASEGSGQVAELGR